MAASEAPEHGADDLFDELRATRASLDGMSDTVTGLIEANDRSRVVQAVLGAVAAVTLALVIAVAGLALWAFDLQRRTDADLRAFGRQLYLSACHTGNESRETTRQSNVADAEALIQITNTDVKNPELAAQYRAVTEERNRLIVDRDCQAELREVERAE